MSNLVKEGKHMEDKKITCKDCGCEFTFTAGEQEFYKEKGFDNEPQRCPECRAARKRQRNNY
jgi:transposase-like protein